ncbi:MAG: hypothetical protein J1F35_07085 [Erysipelotrichales bacterium]|nr:hypothetical protein [Erysipelotrichales bacterium]
MVLPINGIDVELPLKEGVTFLEGTSHFGFVIIVDDGNNQIEETYRTDNEISDIGISNNTITIYERNVNKPWRFSLNGALIEENKPTIDFSNYVASVTEIESDKKISEKTITLVIEENPKDNHIEFKGESFELSKGLVVGDGLYGIEIKNNAIGGEIKKIPTEEPIYGAGSDESFKYGFQVYENGKYHPWRFDSKGKVISEASYNPYSRQDQAYYLKKHHKRLELK